MTVTVLNNQTIADVSMQCYGSIEKMFDIANDLGCGITDELEAGALLELSELDTLAKEKKIATVLNYLSNQPASAEIRTELITPGGIGYMQIGNNFKVN